MPTHTAPHIGGKVSMATTLFGVALLFVALVVDLPGGIVSANVATTSVRVLNTPPLWTVDAQESPGSSTTTPTNSGSNVTWVATADDSSLNNYYLIICKTSASPTPVNGGAPVCAGGISNRWAISASTVSGQEASAATTTTEGFTSLNDWYAWICDNDAVGAQCNFQYRQGNGTTSSPFVVNHRPVFTAVSNDGPINPGGTLTWTTTSSDADNFNGQDTVQAFVCKSADFTGTFCGAGGTWATSTAVVANAATGTTISNPYPDSTYSAFVYVIDSFGHNAVTGVGSAQGTSSPMVVNNITPSILAGDISLLDTDGAGPLTLTNMATQTPGFSVQYTVSDQNSCRTIAAGNEIIFGLTNVYRSGITQTGCDAAGEYDANNCYPGSVSTQVWGVSCTASSTSCSGTSDPDAIWTCTFPLWYVAESTDGTGIATDPPNWAENWLASAQAGDDDFATSSLVESSLGVELTSFLAYNLSTSSIAYGGLQPGQLTDPLAQTVELLATGNVGLDETLYGTDMCPTYPTCGGNATNTIPVGEQRYNTTASAYAAATTLLANPGAELELNVPKSTATATPASQSTHWGISVPIAITLSGDYLGVNTLIGITGESASW